MCKISAEGSDDASSQIWGEIAPKPPPNPAGIFMSVEVLPSAIKACNINTH